MERISLISSTLNYISGRIKTLGEVDDDLYLVGGGDYENDMIFHTVFRTKQEAEKAINRHSHFDNPHTDPYPEKLSEEEFKKLIKLPEFKSWLATDKPTWQSAGYY